MKNLSLPDVHLEKNLQTKSIQHKRDNRYPKNSNGHDKDQICESNHICLYQGSEPATSIKITKCQNQI